MIVIILLLVPNIRRVGIFILSITKFFNISFFLLFIFFRCYNIIIIVLYLSAYCAGFMADTPGTICILYIHWTVAMKKVLRRKRRMFKEESKNKYYHRKVGNRNYSKKNEQKFIDLFHYKLYWEINAHTIPQLSLLQKN